MSGHALLSASGASKWLNCTPSARQEELVPYTESPYADEGTLAHKMAEYRIKEIAYKVDLSHFINPLKEHELYDESMYDYITEYANFVVDKVREAPEGAVLLQEYRVDFSEFVPEGFGTLDVGISAPRVLKLVDLKYGKGVPVSAIENKQMMLYGLGLYLDYCILYDIEEIEMTIYQPRIDNISSYTISVHDLLKWAREVVKPTALIAFAGLGDYVAGDHCRFCRIRATCKANVQLNLQLAAKEFDIPTVTDDQVVKILKRAASIKNWVNAVEAHALKMAISGYKWPGMKVVQGRSTRKYSDQNAIIEKLIENGYSEEKIVTKKLTGISNLSKIVTKLHFNELVEPHVFKPRGAPTLVPDSDKRAEWNSAEAAYIDFEVVEGEE